MPIYEFKCSDCGTIHEYILGINEAHPKICGNCGKDSLQKIMSTSNFVLKGQGWYETDFKDKKTKKDDKVTPSSSKNKTTKDTETKSSEAKSLNKSPESSSSENKKSTSKKACS